MLATFINRARGARGVQTIDRGTVMVEPGETARLDLAEHPLHQAWEAAGDVEILGVEEEAERPAPTQAGRPPDKKAQHVPRPRK